MSRYDQASRASGYGSLFLTCVAVGLLIGLSGWVPDVMVQEAEMVAKVKPRKVVYQEDRLPPVVIENYSRNDYARPEVEQVVFNSRGKAVDIIASYIPNRDKEVYAEADSTYVDTDGGIHLKKCVVLGMCN